MTKRESNPAATKRTNRTPAVVVIEDKAPDQAPAQGDRAQGGDQAQGEVIAPVGTSIPANVVTLPGSEAAANLADRVGNGAPITVEAPKTPAQIAAASFGTTINAAWSHMFGQRPQGGTAFIEPDKAALKVLRKAWLEAYNAANPESPLDPSDPDDYAEAVLGVNVQIATQRAAHAAAAANQASVDREWARASLSELESLVATIKHIAGRSKAQGGESTDGGEPKERKARTSTTEKWAEWSPKMHAYAQSIGLAGVYLLDITDGGYKGSYHALKIRTDGTLERVNYDPTHRTFTDTGVIVSTWRYFGKDGVSFDENPNQERIDHNLFTKNEMFGVAMVNAQGGIVDVPGVTLDRTDKDGKRVAGSLKPYAQWTAFASAAGLDA